MAINLEPCRYCGSKEARHIARKYSEPTGYYVLCDTYHGGCGHETVLADSIDSAYDCWNSEMKEKVQDD